MKKNNDNEKYIEPLDELKRIMSGCVNTNILCIMGEQEIMQKEDKYYIASAYSNAIYKEINKEVAEEMCKDIELNQAFNKKKNSNYIVE